MKTSLLGSTSVLAVCFYWEQCLFLEKEGRDMDFCDWLSATAVYIRRLTASERKELQRRGKFVDARYVTRETIDSSVVWYHRTLPAAQLFARMQGLVPLTVH